MKKLQLAFYRRDNVLAIAQELLGKLLVTTFQGKRTSGRIVETEAYNGIVDKASHAFSGRRTKRTEIMYGAGGCAYVYICYGIHNLFNVVTSDHGTPHAVLIRGVEPVEGISWMMERMHKGKFNHSVGRGPGNVSKAMGISTAHTGLSLLKHEMFLADDGTMIPSSEMIASPRIGVDYAGKDAQLLYRYFVKGNEYVSGKQP